MLLSSNLGKKTGLTLCLMMALAGCSDSNESTAGPDFNTGVTDGGNTDNGNSNGNNIDFDEKQLLLDLSQHVFVPAVQSFETSSQDLISAVATYCQSLESDPDAVAVNQQAAQQAWIHSMAQWQQLEVMQVGPLIDNDGKLRNAVYSWPVTSHCAVDQDVGHFEAGIVNDSVYDITKRTLTRRGLDAAEYLLFNEDLDHSCSKDSTAPEGWNDRSNNERQLARCNFASEVVQNVNTSAQQLTAAWVTEQTGFQTVLGTAGETGNKFETTKAAINHITDAMFYIDSITKDEKLAKPIGLSDSNSCGNAACVEDIESEISNNAINNIRANMVALQSLFFGAPIGTEALGFDDYLKAVDQEQLATDMANDIQAAIDATDAFAGTMTVAVTNNPDKVQTLHQAVKKVTDNLKSLFITYLSLELPLTSAGDAD